MFNDPIYSSAIVHSLVLAALAMVITVPLGVSLSIFLSRWRGASAKPVTFLSTVPLVVPELVLALAMFFLVTHLLHFVSLGTPAQVAGQVTFILPLVIVVTRGRLASIPIGYEEAAMDLGASPMPGVPARADPAAAAGDPRERDHHLRRLDRRLRDHAVHVLELGNAIGADVDLHSDAWDGDAGAQRDGNGDGDHDGRHLRHRLCPLSPAGAA